MEARQIRNIVLVALAFILIAGSRTIADYVIEYQWWNEVGQVDTWLKMLVYEIAPAIGAALIAWLVAVWAHSRALGFVGVPAGAYQLYACLVTAALFFAAIIFVGSGVDAEKVMAFVGGAGVTVPGDAWQDPVFSKDLSFYLFDLPFFGVLLRFLFMTTLLSVVVFWATARGWQIYERLQRFRESGGRMEEFDAGPNPLLLEGATETSFARVLGSILLAAAAAWFYLGQYRLLLNSHSFMTGMDYVDEVVSLPLRWVVVVSMLAAIPLLWGRRLKLAGGIVAGALIANTILPAAVRSLYVTPNELRLEKPYIARHLEATVEAYALNRGEETEFQASLTEELDVNANSTLVDNIRLWDTSAFTDTITQIQALRPYYRFADIDVDRYQIDGKIKQVLLSPREIDINQLPAEARASWTNTHFIYTHGYGVVMAEVNRTTNDGLPVLMIQDAPPDIRTEGLKLERPEIYFGEVTHDPVFVNTDEREFDYPSGSENIYSSYQGTGGFPISSLALRLAAAIRDAEYNIVLTGQTNENSRMMIYRDVTERLEHLAGFIQWDGDPYLVLTEDGRLEWIVDGYTTSDAHPYSQPLVLGGFGRTRINYIRNSVKATVDAYNGTTRLYVFDEADPIIQAYRSLFPDLFLDQSEMPSEVRSHVRYPLAMFSIQAELYRTYHMKDPEVFYNKEDIWEVAKSLAGSGGAEPMRPTYIVATLPGETEPEFILMLPFTPRGKDNLIGWMAARCDGENLGEMEYFQLSKQQLVFGPNQIESRINQDSEIAKDLTLWDQQGSRVLRGELLALPVGNTFLYVESIYIQAETARMPQLRKVVIALGNRLIYEDTFEEALIRLSNGSFRPASFGEVPPPVTQLSPDEELRRDDGSSNEQSRARALANRLQTLREQAEELAEELQSLEKELRR